MSERDACFPITPEIAQEVRGEVGNSPIVISQEKSLVDNGNKELAVVLAGIQSGLYVMHDDFEEGAIIAHRILRRQAEERGKSLPILPEGFNSVCMQDYIEGALPRGFGLEDYLIEIGANLEGQDTILSEVLNELGSQREGARIFKGGGAIVALVYRKYFEGQELEQKFWPDVI